MQVIRPHYGGMLISDIGLDRLGTFLLKGAVVGRRVHPQTLEVLTAPFDPSVVVLAREGFSPVNTGDYGFMFACPVRL